MRVLVRVIMRVYSSVCMTVFVGVLMLVIVTVRVLVCVWMLVLVILYGMRVFVLMALVRQGVDLGSGQAAARDFPVFEASANVERRSSVLKQREGNTSIDEGAEKHVAADAREAFKISYTHQERL